MISYRKVGLPLAGLDALQSEAAAQGFEFLDRLEAEWITGANRFSAPGESLFGAFEGDLLVAIGGLNRDPFLGDPTVGRIRRIFVRTAWRGRGIASNLVKVLLDEARPNFRQLRLRAVTPDAARIYVQLGFIPIADPHATHILTF